MSHRPSYLLGLVGAGIGASLTPAMQEREGEAAGLRITYRLLDADKRGFGVDDLPEVLGWAQRLGFDGLNITHPFKQAVIPLLDELSEDAADLGAVNTVVFRDGRALGRNTDWSGYGRAFRQVLPDAVEDRVVLVGAGGAGAAVGYGLLEQGAEHVTVIDSDRDRADACVVRLAKRFGDDRVASRPTSSGRSPTRTAWSTPPRSACTGIRGCPCRRGWSRTGCGSPTSSTSHSRPSWSRWPGLAAAGSSPAAGWPCTRRSARSSTSPAGPPTRPG